MSTIPCATCTAEVADSNDLRELVHANRAVLARVARAEGLKGEDVFDAVQEAFTAFLEHGGPHRGGGLPARRTLMAYVRNIARNRRRLHANARPHDGDDAVDALAAPPEAEDRLLDAEERERLQCCVGQLGEVQRAVVTLRMLEELPGAEVADQLGLAPGHVAVLLHRAKSALATCLSEEP
jgi:RNA polymerase sigma-70 factor (ECF subfamily)